MKRTLLGGVALLVILVAVALNYVDLPTGSAIPRLGGEATDGPSTGMPEPPPLAATRAQFKELSVGRAGSMRGYDRERFSHWSSQGESCSTREVVLKRDGENVKTDDECAATEGRWYSLYDKRWIDEARGIDIDHMVPLANAWRSGADDWTDEKRERFANDLERGQLIAVSASSNRAKGDQDPSQWRPSNQDWWCDYARHWIDVKHHYQLRITNAEKSALVEMLESCD